MNELLKYTVIEVGQNQWWIGLSLWIFLKFKFSWKKFKGLFTFKTDLVVAK